jgi:hypothetical protein
LGLPQESDSAPIARVKSVNARLMLKVIRTAC